MYSMDMKRKVTLQLVGLDGNAFSVMGAFKRAASRQGWSGNEIKTVLDDCMSGDYDHLLAVILANTQTPDEAEETAED
jgi:hypothetical protein